MIVGYSRTFAAAGPPLTNLTAQFDFSQIDHLWKTISGATPCYSNQATADGDAIAVASSIIPVPTSEYCFTNDGTGARSPTLKLTTPLLKAQCLSFDGSGNYLGFSNRINNFLLFSTVFSATAMTLFVSFRIATMPTSGNFGPIIFDGGGNFWGIRIQGTSGKIAYLMHDAGGYTGHEGAVVSANTNYVACMQHDATTIYGSINNGTVSTSASGTMNQTNHRFYLGADTGPGWFFNGRIGEVLMYNAVLSGTDLTNGWNYMMNKWI